MHNSILEYASTTNISQLWPYYFIWKGIFEDVIFLLKYHQNPQGMEHRKKRKKEGKCIEKIRGRKRKPPWVSPNKGEVNILRGEKHLNFKIFFLMWFHFLPLHHIISKTHSKIIEKVFLTIFGPCFSFTICITWVVPFLFTHELHIFSL
jgi:hypothetical protein